MKRLVLPVVPLLLLGLVIAMGQSPSSENLAMSITAARKKNAALMRNYNWNSRVELIENGKVLDTRINEVNYGPDGTVQRSLINDERASLPRGFLRRAVAENKREEMAKHLKGLGGLLDQYTLATAGKMLDFVDSATVQTDSLGHVNIAGNNVVNPGDSLTLTLDGKTLQTRKIQVHTTYEGSAVTLTASYKTNKAGLTYPAFAEVSVPDKNVALMVHNFDYVPND